MTGAFEVQWEGPLGNTLRQVFPTRPDADAFAERQIQKLHARAPQDPQSEVRVLHVLRTIRSTKEDHTHGT